MRVYALVCSRAWGARCVVSVRVDACGAARCWCAWRARVCMRAASHHLHASAAARAAAGGSPSPRGTSLRRPSARRSSRAAPPPAPPPEAGPPAPPPRVRPPSPLPIRHRPIFGAARLAATRPAAARLVSPAPGPLIRPPPPWRAPARRRNRRQARPTSPPGHRRPRHQRLGLPRRPWRCCRRCQSPSSRQTLPMDRLCKLRDRPDRYIVYVLCLYYVCNSMVRLVHAHAKACHQVFLPSDAWDKYLHICHIIKL